MKTYDQLLIECALPRLEARMLMEHASGKERTWLIAHGTEPVPAALVSAFSTLTHRRRAGEPMAYLVGEREFHGLCLSITPAVLIPRPETEVLVGAAIARAPRDGRVLDLGTGSGAIALALAHARPDLHITATDDSAHALALAQANAQKLGLMPRVRWLQGSWWQAVPSDERFDLVLSNPPYIPENDIHLHRDDLRFEPRSALASGPDGLNALRDIVRGAPRHMAYGAWLILEHGFDQGQAVCQLLTTAGLTQAITLQDLAGLDRISLARHNSP